jgi:hypothetical protein
MRSALATAGSWGQYLLTTNFAWLRIPIQSGHPYRFDVGHRSDLIPATIPI